MEIVDSDVRDSDVNSRAPFEPHQFDKLWNRVCHFAGLLLRSRRHSLYGLSKHLAAHMFGIFSVGLGPQLCHARPA